MLGSHLTDGDIIWHGGTSKPQRKAHQLQMRMANQKESYRVHQYYCPQKPQSEMFKWSLCAETQVLEVVSWERTRVDCVETALEAREQCDTGWGVECHIWGNLGGGLGQQKKQGTIVGEDERRRDGLPQKYLSMHASGLSECGAQAMGGEEATYLGYGRPGATSAD